jgi:hypothetical protein
LPNQNKGSKIKEPFGITRVHRYLFLLVTDEENKWKRFSHIRPFFLISQEGTGSSYTFFLAIIRSAEISQKVTFIPRGPQLLI